MKTVYCGLFLIAGFIPFCFSDNNVWAKADSKITAILNQTDDLISKKAYYSAYKQLNNYSVDNDFILAKEMQICLNYFISSIGHKMFALADLTPEQTVDSMRGQDGSYQMVLCDPTKTFPEYELAHGQSGILRYMLGQYYSEVLNHYPDSEQDESVIQNSLENYKLAFAMGYSDAHTLGNAGELSIRVGNFENAITYMTQAISLDSSNGNLYYNLAYAYLNAGKNDMALKNLLVAMKIYKNDAQYQYDSYLMESDIYTNLAKFNEALAALDNATTINSQDYHLPLKKNNIYLKMSNFIKAQDFALELFAFGPTNPAAPQLIIENYKKYKYNSQLIDFFNTAIKKYQDNQQALGNLYFYKSEIEYQSNQKDKAISDIKMAKDYFLKVLPATEQVFQAIDDALETYSK
jgi:tetratricopeptide (TPR) repeat protein